MAHFGALLGFGLRQYSRALPYLQRLHTFSPGGKFISSDGAHEILGCKGVFRGFELATRIGQDVRAA